MIDSLISFITWGLAIGLAGVAVLLMLNKQSGLRMIQHRPEILPQALLVRYAGSALLALVAAWIGAPRILFAALLMIGMVAMGDVYIYRRAGYPFWLHLVVGVGALLCALVALFTTGGTS